MVRSFREKKMKKAGTWTSADEEKKQQQVEEKKMFDDYDEPMPEEISGNLVQLLHRKISFDKNFDECFGRLRCHACY
jgi:hypothetical protein